MTASEKAARLAYRAYGKEVHMRDDSTRSFDELSDREKAGWRAVVRVVAVHTAEEVIDAYQRLSSELKEELDNA